MDSLRAELLPHYNMYMRTFNVTSGLLFRIVGLAVFCGLSIGVAALDLPTEPQLRIEAGMHIAMINRIDTDKFGRWAVTTSDDKTARIWDIRTGSLVSILRPPIAGDDEGKLYAGTISPDGNRIAVAGWTKLGSQSGHTIYIFDRPSGRLVKSLQGLPNVINSLGYSKDGRWLAAGIGGSNGIRVWNIERDDSMLSDAAMGANCYGVAWSADGRLAATCYDGQLRMYRPMPGKLQKLGTVRGTSGQRFFGVAFSPDSRYLLAGYSDLLAVELYETTNLTLVKKLQTPESTNNMGRVAWSIDGQYAYAAGSYGDDTPVRRWSAPDFTDFIDIPTMCSSIMGMMPLPDGSILAGASDPAWGIVTTSGIWKYLGIPPIADYTSQKDNFSITPNADIIQFGYKMKGKEPWTFTLQTRVLSSGINSGTSPAATSALNVKDWRNSTTPSLNGVTLEIDKYERSRCLAITPDSSKFILGTTWSLRLYNSTGKELWNKPVPAEVQAVNITSSGKIVVAAYGDGTIRWHRIIDGQELLAFFPHADKKRWVLWTPSGYYDASVGGEELIGWHLNRGVDQAADFFPAGKFRDRFYRPDVIDHVLETMDESAAIKMADALRGTKIQPVIAISQALPPVIDLVSPSEISTNQTTVTIRYRVRAPADAPVLAVRSRINGQAIDQGQKGLTVVGQNSGTDEQTLTLTLPKKNSDVQFFAENRHGISTPATVRITWTGSNEEFSIKPKLYILAVGISAYQNADIPKLGLAAKDAKDFAAAMKGQQGKLYREVEVKILTDKDATRDDIVDGLDWLQKQVTQHDIGMLFLSGHGVNDPSLGYVYLPVNADPDKLKRSGVAMNDIKSTLASLTGKAVFFLDTCHSGNVLGATRRAVGNEIGGVINELSSAENGVVVFSSSTGRQYSLEKPEWGNGAFTKALIEGLSGKADYQGSGRVTFKMLDLYVSERVKKLTDGQQSPVTQAPGGVPDFPLSTK